MCLCWFALYSSYFVRVLVIRLHLASSTVHRDDNHLTAPLYRPIDAYSYVSTTGCNYSFLLGICVSTWASVILQFTFYIMYISYKIYTYNNKQKARIGRWLLMSCDVHHCIANKMVARQRYWIPWTTFRSGLLWPILITAKIVFLMLLRI